MLQFLANVAGPQIFNHNSLLSSMKTMVKEGLVKRLLMCAIHCFWPDLFQWYRWRH